MSEQLIAIAVEDEPKALEVIQIHAKKIPFLALRRSFRDALAAISWLQDNQVDLIFLDINMPSLSGLKFREYVGPAPMIIFTTAYAKYAVESYNLNAVDYLLKPISFDRFFKAALKARESWQLRQGKTIHPTPTPSSTQPTEGQHFIYVKSGSKLYKVSPSDILFLEKNGNYVFFHTKTQKIISRLNMSQLLELLPSTGFLKVHKSYIISLQHIEVVEPGQVMIAGQKIPIAKAYKEELMNALL